MHAFQDLSTALSGFIIDLPGFFWADQNSRTLYILHNYICLENQVKTVARTRVLSNIKKHSDTAIEYSYCSLISESAISHPKWGGGIFLAKMCIGNSGSYSCQIKRIFFKSEVEHLPILNQPNFQ